MEEILLRFPQIGEKILNFLDERSLQNCKIVNKNLKNFIEDPSQKLLCIRSITQQSSYEEHTHILCLLIKVQNVQIFCAKI